VRLQKLHFGQSGNNFSILIVRNEPDESQPCGTLVSHQLEEKLASKDAFLLHGQSDADPLVLPRSVRPYRARLANVKGMF
jgi:hypothetical protein